MKLGKKKQKKKKNKRLNLNNDDMAINEDNTENTENMNDNTNDQSQQITKKDDKIDNESDSESSADLKAFVQSLNKKTRYSYAFFCCVCVFFAFTHNVLCMNETKQTPKKTQKLLQKVTNS